MSALPAILALALGAMSGPASASPGISQCEERLCQAERLAPVAQKLNENKPIHIMMIGDSLTAGDALSHGWREAFDSLYGSFGRGVVDGARPYAGYLTWGMNSTASPGWVVNGIFGKAWQSTGGPAVGLSGYTKSAHFAGEWMTLTAEDPRYTFDLFVLCGQTGPNAGSLQVAMGSETYVFTLKADDAGPQCMEVRALQPAGSVTIQTLEDKPVNINSIGTFRATGAGITVSNLGVPGSQLVHANRKDAATISAELNAYHPDMVVIAFGTNEGFNSALDIKGYEANLRNHIQFMRSQLPSTVPLMLIGPPNALTRNKAIAQAGQIVPFVCETGLMVPGNIQHVNTIQRLVAKEMGLVFWDWGMAMGPPCAMYEWRAARLTAQDAIHFRKAGGKRLGEILAADLHNAFRTIGEGWQAQTGLPANDTGVQIIQ
jgi:lysophospholipase L1-like esterase